ncbi:uncharacterized protein LOC62_05G006732 [Vanrija pseudolonga]|uniref:Uncharacterized protein n=1 Tax=Vanrija pseudolonga TaxID=143232 RepID=A0AAF0YE62_9TREE|nr:hypothetical protein LOC62_05G006732 [Vanrija pseudolonga]
MATNGSSPPPDDWLDSHSVLAAFLITSLSLITIICLYFLWVNPRYLTPWRKSSRKSTDLEKGRNGGHRHLPPAISPSKWRVDGRLPDNIVMPRRKEPMPPTPPILRKEPSTPTRAWGKEPSTPTTPTKAAESGHWERPFPPPPIRMDPHGSWSSFSTTSTMVAKPNKDRFSLPALEKGVPASPLRDRGSIGSLPRAREASNLRHFSTSGESMSSFAATAIQPSIEDHEPRPIPSNSVPGATTGFTHRRSTSSTSSKRNSKRSSLTISIAKASAENPETSIIITAEQPEEAPYAVELSPPPSKSPARNSRKSLSDSPNSRPISVSFSIPDTPTRNSKRSSASRASMKRVGQNQSRYSLTFPGNTFEPALPPPVPAVASHFRGSIHMPTVRKPAATSHVPFPASGGRPASSGGWAQLPDGSVGDHDDNAERSSRPDSFFDRGLAAPNLPFARHDRRDSEMSYKSYKSHYNYTASSDSTVAERRGPWLHARPIVL